jgi:YidC/Oxa1 family membrane protein insertase
MQVVQPKIKELQKKYKNDRAKLQQETMKLYQEHHVNPFASCLPLLLQLPVFISLYYAIRGTEEINTASFLWIDSLGAPNTFLLVLYVITQLISTELTLTTMSDPRQKWMMRAMPFIFVIVLLNFPAGLFLYWITTNLWTIGQQLIIRQLAPVTVKSGGKSPKRSRFMESMMAAQQERTRQRDEVLETKSGDKALSGKATAGKPGGKGAAGKPGGKGAPPKGGQPTKGGQQAKDSRRAKSGQQTKGGGKKPAAGGQAGGKGSPAESTQQSGGEPQGS